MSTKGAPGVYVIPEGFRFSDENPLTGLAYGRSRFDDLPPYVQDVVEGTLGLSSSAWDDLVFDGDGYAEPGGWRWFSLRHFLTSLSRRAGRSPSRNLCGDCWGTLAAVDPDGSVTGRVGKAYLCGCANPGKVISYYRGPGEPWF